MEGKGGERGLLKKGWKKEKGSDWVKLEINRFLIKFVLVGK